MLSSVWAILGTIILGVATNLLTPFVVKLFENISSKVKRRNEEKKIIFQNTVKYIVDNPNEEIILRIRYLQRGFTSLVAVIIGFVCMVTNNPLLILTGFIFSIIGYWGNSKADKLRKILQEVTKQKNSSRPDIDLA